MAEQCFVPERDERALSAAEMAQLRGTDEIGSSKDLLGRASANHDGTFKHDGQLKVKPWEARGDFDEAHPGAAYWDIGDALQFPAAQHVGVAYQIASFGPIDTASESFNILLEVTTLHAIEEDDVSVYKQAQARTKMMRAALLGDDDGASRERPQPGGQSDYFEILMTRTVRPLHTFWLPFFVAP